MERGGGDGVRIGSKWQRGEGGGGGGVVQISAGLRNVFKYC